MYSIVEDSEKLNAVCLKNKLVNIYIVYPKGNVVALYDAIRIFWSEYEKQIVNWHIINR